MPLSQEGYEEWLTTGGYTTLTQHVSKVRVLESKLDELGLPFKRSKGGLVRRPI